MTKAMTTVVLMVGLMLAAVFACSQEGWHLSTIVDGQGSVSPNKGIYSDGEIITLTAIPTSFWSFQQWGSTVNGSENPIAITMDSDKTVYAFFSIAMTPTPEPLEACSTYTDEVDGFSISYPEEWVLLPNVKFENVLVMFWGGFCDEWMTDVSIANEKLDYPSNVRQLFKDNQYAGLHREGYTPLSEEELIVSGKPAIKHLCTQVIEGSTMKIMQVLMVENESCWIFTFRTSPTCWSQHEDIFDYMVNSFQLLD